MRIPAFLLSYFLPAVVWAADMTHPAPASPGNGRDAMMANSPFTVYTAGAVGYVLVAMVLILALLIGAFLVVNLGMMAKRPEDQRRGKPEPSDIGILKGERFGIENERRILPSEEEGEHKHHAA